MKYLGFLTWASVAVSFCGCVLDYAINEQLDNSTESEQIIDSSESTEISTDSDTELSNTDSSEDTGQQVDDCPRDPEKTDPGLCGCGTSDADSDEDGVPDCIDQCPSDPRKTSPGSCGCGVWDCDDMCDEKQCAHGQCTEIDDSSYCQCDPGWEGANCDQNIDDCTPNPCAHGKCRDGLSSYTCQCDPGWTGENCDQAEPVTVLTWVSIPGGEFQMGSSDEKAESEMPVHTVNVHGFEMTKTEVTVNQYGECVNAGVCTAPDAASTVCNWKHPGSDHHPVNCVSWEQAVNFCEWVGGRLPSESEWEYAARSGGKDIKYPWGNANATCDYAVMIDDFHKTGCDTYRSWEVCSKPAGNTDQGLCDMAGNVYEWVQDWLHADYTGAPEDGSAWETPVGSRRVIRGGSLTENFYGMRAAYRYTESYLFDYSIGFRCAR